MRKTEFVVYWRKGDSSFCEPFAIGDGVTEDEAQQKAQALVNELLDGDGVEGVRLEKHSPSPYHARYDINTLYPALKD